MASIEQELGEAARGEEEKMQLSDKGMAMDSEEVPHGGKQDPHEDGEAITPAHKDD